MERLSETQSICSICKKPVAAYYGEEKGKVYFIKNCKTHGQTKTLVANEAEAYKKWIKHPVVNIPPKMALTEGQEGECPLHCGTCDQHLQTACCVLLDITERCNQSCPYCFAKAGEDDESQDPTLEEIERWYDGLLELGEERPFNIQLSGGEPTVRQDLPEIIAMGRAKGFDYIQLNTNGKRLAQEEGYGKILKKAGVSVAFLQFDGTEDRIYETLRGEPLFSQKKKAIANCRKAGIPVTLVPTMTKQVNMDNIGDMMKFMLENIDVVKGIHFQPVSFFGRHPEDYENRVTMFDVMNELERQTGGQFQREDLVPISTGHSLCCFCGSYLKELDGHIKSLISKETKTVGLGCCDEMDPLDIIKKDRDFVLNKWELPEREEEECSCCGEAPVEEVGCCCSGEDEVMDFDQLLTYLRKNMFTVSGMAFQDLSNLDAERVKRCRVQVYTKDEKLIPFCAYNSLYRV
ncbi:MAG: radical SAM protein [Anaerovorax sp.]